MGKKKPDPKRSGKKSAGKDNKADDFLERHGMGKAQQHGAGMRAAAVPASDFEGEYKGPGTYNSPGAQRLQRILWEVRMRGATGIPKLGDDDMPNQRKDAMDLIVRGPKTTASPSPSRGPKRDSLSGLTSEYGTKSLLKGMLKFLR
jgi:hypothetical protein